MKYITKNGQATGSELVDYLGITDRAVRKQLKTLLSDGRLRKVGKPPKVYYLIAKENVLVNQVSKADILVDEKTKKIIEGNFLYITPMGTEQKGFEGFVYWCNERTLDLNKMAISYMKVLEKYSKYKKDGLINGMSKMKSSFEDVALDRLFYIDFYSAEIFGKTKLGQLLLFAKQSQNKRLINEISDLVKPVVLQIINSYGVDGVGFVPPTVKREVQFIKQIQKNLNLDVRLVPITKIKTPVAVPQKTLSKLEDRVANAKETISVDAKGSYKNILLIDDAVGSGSTLNETAKKIRQKGLCSGEIIGLAVTGSFKGFDVISEV